MFVDQVLLLCVFLEVSAEQSLLLRGPEDQVVSLGQNASFHCDTLSNDVYWRVTGDLEFSSDHNDHDLSSAAHYLVRESRDHQYGNTTLTVFTSEQVSSMRITCHYYSSLRINHASRTAYLFACSVPLQEPIDQKVVQGRNASFHCHTRSTSAHWMVLEGQVFTPIENYSAMLYYYEESRNESTYASTLIVTTSEWVQNLTIVCLYDPNCTTSRAHLMTVSCFEATPVEHLVVTKATFYHNNNETLTKVSFEVPLSCEYSPINYTVLIMDSAGRIALSKGPIQYRGVQLVEEELIGFLQNGQVYSVHVEARASGQIVTSSNQLRIDTLWSGGSSQSDFTTGQESNNRTARNNNTDPFKDQLTVTAAALGSLVAALFGTTVLFLVTTIRCAGGCHLKASGHDPRLVSLQTMVSNPIYDGPMYESIEQNFSNTTDTPNANKADPTVPTPGCSLGLCYSATKTPSNYENIASPIVSNTELAPTMQSQSSGAASFYSASPTTKLKTSEVFQNQLTLQENISGSKHASAAATGESDNEPKNLNDEYYALVNPPKMGTSCSGE